MEGIRAYICYKTEMKEEVVSRLSSLNGEILEVSEILNVIIYRPHRVNVAQLETIDGVLTVTNKRGKALE